MYKCAPLSPYLLARSSRCAGQILEERKQKWEGGNTLFHLCCHCAWNCCWMQGTDPIHCSILPFLWTFQTEPQNWLEEESQMKALLIQRKSLSFLGAASPCLALLLYLYREWQRMAEQRLWMRSVGTRWDGCHLQQIQFNFSISRSECTETEIPGQPYSKKKFWKIFQGWFHIKFNTWGYIGQTSWL